MLNLMSESAKENRDVFKKLILNTLTTLKFFKDSLYVAMASCLNSLSTSPIMTINNTIINVVATTGTSPLFKLFNLILP